MCMQGFAIGPGPLAALIAAGVILSPILLPAALVYTVVRSVKDGVEEISYERASAAAEVDKQKSEPSEVKAELQRLMDAAGSNRSFETLFAFGAGLCGYKDYIGSIHIFEEALELVENYGDLKFRNIALVSYYMGLAYQQSHRFDDALSHFEAAESAIQQYQLKEGEVTLTRSDILAAKAYLMYLRSVYNTQDDFSTEETKLLEALDIINTAIELAGGREDLTYYANRSWIHYELAWVPYRALGATRPSWYEKDEILKVIRPEFAVKALIDLDHVERLAKAREQSVPIELLSLRINALFVAGRKQEAALVATKLKEMSVSVYFVDASEENYIEIGNFSTCAPLFSTDAVTEHFTEHQLEEVTFKKPTWCDVCRGFITLSENVKKENYECKVCEVKCHDRCREVLLKNSCLGPQEGLVVASHKHVVSKRFIHSLHRCQLCKKSIMMMKDVYCCRTCPAYFHEECATICHDVLIETPSSHSSKTTDTHGGGCCHQ